MTTQNDPSPARPEDLLKQVMVELGRAARHDQHEPWFRDLRIASLSLLRCVFVVPSTFARDWLRRNRLAELAAVVRGVAGLETCRVMVESATSMPATARERIAPSMERYGMERHGARDTATGYGAISLPANGTDGMPLGTDSAVSTPRAVRVGRPEAESDSSVVQAPTRAPIDVGSAPREHATDRAPAMTAPSERDAFDENVPGRDESKGGRGDGGPSGSEPPEVSGPRRLGPAGVSCELNRNHTFDQFVVGPCNRLSHAAALAVGDNPGRAYNPLFVHGNVGLGKTHLLQAICHEIRRKDENSRVLYLSCEDFTNRFINSIQAGRLDDFRNLHRTADVLVIDDIQFLAGKDKTQDEFFHTFNALKNANRQIVISSDRPPTEIPTVEERLVSRFKWGLVVEMEVPCLETRTAIVRRKSRARQVEISEEVAFLIARRIDTNIRELEGAINKVLGVAQITERDITVELVDEALRGVVAARTRPIQVSDVIGLVTSEFSVTARELTGKGRAQTVSLPRQVCMYLLRSLTDLSYEEIGRSFSDRDHTTVIYAFKKIEKRVREDRRFRDIVGNLSTKLRGG